MRDADTSGTARLLAVPFAVTLGVLLASGLVGYGVGFVALQMSTGEGFADLGAVILGMLAAAVVLAIGWVVGMAVAARRLFPRGRRLLPVGLALAVMVLAVVVMSVGANVLGSDATGVLPGQWSSLLGGLLVLGAGSIGFAGAARIQGDRAGDPIGR